MLSGIAVSPDGLEQGSMGVDWGDYLHEGRLSMFVTNFTEQPDALISESRRAGIFRCELRCQAGAADLPAWSDGEPASSTWTMTAGWICSSPTGTSIRRWTRFAAPLPIASPYSCFATCATAPSKIFPACCRQFRTHSRRGAAFGDLNNDGRVDVVLVNTGAPPTLLLNQTESKNHRVLFKLVGTRRATGWQSAPG